MSTGDKSSAGEDEGTVLVGVNDDENSVEREERKPLLVLFWAVLDMPYSP